MKELFAIILYISTINLIKSLDNGLARTPPMGWLAWERFKCNTNCKEDPENCISEKLFIDMADKLIEDGYRDAGYNYINIDDCWLAPRRDSQGNMVADPVRFPRGIQFLADYMHSRGLKLGIYQDFGRRTCMGYPGIVGHMEQDAKKFAEWKVDMVKLDGCHSRAEDMDKGYIKMGHYLNMTGRPMIYSCSWPYYQLIRQMQPNYKLIAKNCNMWRNYDDISDSWLSVENTINFFGDNQDVLARYTGPGHWNDPDMLVIGNFHLQEGQARIQMAVWAILPAPLLMSNDLRKMKPEFRDILVNSEVIAVNQDKMGLPGKRMFKKSKVEVWKRPLLSSYRHKTSYALLVINTRIAKSVYVTFLLRELELVNKQGYSVKDLFEDVYYGVYKPNDTLEIVVRPMDVTMLKCEVLV